jgi:hypothetical protein
MKIEKKIKRVNYKSKKRRYKKIKKGICTLNLPDPEGLKQDFRIENAAGNGFCALKVVHRKPGRGEHACVNLKEVKVCFFEGLIERLSEVSGGCGRYLLYEFFKFGQFPFEADRIIGFAAVDHTIIGRAHALHIVSDNRSNWSNTVSAFNAVDIKTYGFKLVDSGLYDAS